MERKIVPSSPRFTSPDIFGIDTGENYEIFFKDVRLCEIKECHMQKPGVRKNHNKKGLFEDLGSYFTTMFAQTAQLVKPIYIGLLSPFLPNSMCCNNQMHTTSETTN